MNRRDFVRLASSSAIAVQAPLRQPSAVPQAVTRKLFIYGGDFDSRFTRYMASLTGKENPKICFMPTASGDSPITIVRWFESCVNLPVRPYVQRAFISSYSQKESFETC